MIPKIIHYCWFGYNPKPRLAEKCIRSWKKYCKDYQIIEWNEDNYDLSSTPIYVQQAYKEKKWAFVTDYIRLDVIYKYGGIYLDTDVELLKNLDCFLQYDAYFGFEDEIYVNTGLGFGAVAGQCILREMMEEYHHLSFIKDDGSYDTLPCPNRNTKILIKHGLISCNQFQTIDQRVVIFPNDYFCPLNWKTKKMCMTSNTYSIHWYDASWWPQEEKMRLKKKLREKKKEKIKGCIIDLFGENVFNLLKRLMLRR